MRGVPVETTRAGDADAEQLDIAYPPRRSAHAHNIRRIAIFGTMLFWVQAASLVYFLH
ncbi:hypothetical protein HDIA_1951 [Hartmannibacter diazotrophicus]|uniref:Uncharacterized protein n=1 Tax=Hartmannibacter diazotrophicus TaxID=1482074 RepID=A0A2C9D575_9HYPH|nr:hypothetical protein [Hartmannibacter diazotrophicus]SON55492.1 hypothetical protein HDIA_1951 [Hartmannibacter diazotrophicus]